MPNGIREIAPGLAKAEEPLEGVATAGQPDDEHFALLAEGGYKAVKLEPAALRCVAAR